MVYILAMYLGIYWGYVGDILSLYEGYIRILEGIYWGYGDNGKMETTIYC